MSSDTVLTAADFQEPDATPEEIDAACVAQLHEGIVYGIFCELAEIARTLPPGKRVPLILEDDRWQVAKEIAGHYKAGDSGADTRRRWWEAKLSASKPDESWKTRCRSKNNEDDDLTDAPLNAYLIFTFDEDVRGSIRWNDYAKRIEIGGDSDLAGRDDMDAVVSAAQNWIAAKYGATISRDAIGHQLTLVAKEHAFNPLHDYLFGLHWDGVKRIDTLFGRYFGADDTSHNRTISRRFMLGAVGRALPVEAWCTSDGRQMGMKFDNIPILEAVQGEKKTAAWEVLGGKFYCSSSVTVADRDSKMLLASNWFVDSPELASFKRAETAAVKAVTTTRTDSYRAPYGRGITHAPRHCVCTGSTNEDHYFDDNTGNRRYWPVKCGRIDLAALMRDRDLLWAEAVATFMAELDCAACHASTDTVAGQRPRCKDHRWWLDRDEEAVAAGEAEKREADQPWEVWKSRIDRWWRELRPENRPESITAGEIALKVGELQGVDRVSKSTLTTIGIAMKRAGFVRLTSSRSYKPSDELREVRHRPAAGPFATPSPPCDCDHCKTTISPRSTQPKNGPSATTFFPQ